MVDQEKIHNQCLSENPEERRHALEKLTDNFLQLLDKQQAWNDLIRLTNDKDGWVRKWTAEALGSVFSDVPDKQQAWNDLIRLNSDDDSFMRTEAADTLGSVFSQAPDKQQAWNDLHRLSSDKNVYVRSRAADALGSAFSHVRDKQQAWDDLHRLTNDKSSYVRYMATGALCSVFTQVSDKQQAWNDLIRLTNDEDSDVRHWAADALGSAFSQVPDKQQAWNDLHRLTSDKNFYVRSGAAEAIGSTFSQVPDKQQAWNDLRRLTNDRESYVRVYSNHALGKVSISKASQAKIEEDYKKELERAISFFEKAVQQSHYLYNPSKFCLPFYRSFYTILFKKQEAIEEVNKYLEEAKSAIEGSKSKELLFEAVKNLAEALKEVRSLENLDLETKKGKLNFYRKYCEHAIELLIDTEETAPFTIGTIRKGLPFLDKKLKNIIQNRVLEKEISDHIKKSSNWFRENFIGLNENQDKVYALKYFSPAYFQSFLNNGKRLFISKSPGFTWGDGVYLTSIKNPYSSMMYGSIGVMGWIDTEDIENVYDACSPEGIELYQRWIVYTKGLYSCLTTTVHADWANRLLRNKFRKMFKIDIVVFHPDQYNMKYCDKKQDFWFLVSDWVSGRPSYSKKIRECKPLVIVGENFEKIGSGRLFSDLIGKNFVSYTYHFHAPPNSKGRPSLPLITSLIAFHSHSGNIIIVRP